MKKQKEIFTGIIIAIIGFVLAVIVAIVVVENEIPSNASNDGWLGFLGGLFGSFVSGIITFLILYINRKDMLDDQIKRQKMSELYKVEEYLKEAFNFLRIGGEDKLAVTDFKLILSKIES